MTTGAKPDELELAIRQVLLNEWDPIGISDVPEAGDEYDSYASHIRSLLARGATKTELVAYLLESEAESMGLTANREQANSIADRLLRIGCA